MKYQDKKITQLVAMPAGWTYAYLQELGDGEFSVFYVDVTAQAVVHVVDGEGNLDSQSELDFVVLEENEDTPILLSEFKSLYIEPGWGFGIYTPGVRVDSELVDAWVVGIEARRQKQGATA